MPGIRKTWQQPSKSEFGTSIPGKAELRQIRRQVSSQCEVVSQPLVLIQPGAWLTHSEV